MLTVDAKALKSAVAIVARSVASPKDGRPQLSGVHLRVHAVGSVDLVATDGFRLTVATIANTGDGEPVAVTLDLKALKAALKALPNRGAVTLERGPTHASSWTVGDTLVPQIPGTYPDYLSIIPSATDGTPYAVDVDEMLLGLTPIAKPAKGDTHIVHLYGSCSEQTIQNRLVALTASGTPYAKYERWFHGFAPETPIAHPHEFLASVNPKYLMDIVGSHRGQSLTLNVRSANQGMTFAALGVVHVLMPCVSDADTRPALSCAAAKPVDVWTMNPEQFVDAVIDLAAQLPPKPEPAPRGQERAVVPLSCQECGSHEIDRAEGMHAPLTGTCAECGGAAEIDPNVVYGPIIRDAGPNERGGIDRDQARENVAIKRAARRVAHAADAATARRCPACHAAAKSADVYCYHCGVNLDTGTDDPMPAPTVRCSCGADLEPADRFCAMCGTPTGKAAETSPIVHDDTPAADDARVAATFVAIAQKYHGKNPLRIYAALPTATDVRGFHDWLKVGRCVRKGEHGARIWVPIMRDAVSTHWQDAGRDLGKKASGMRPATVFDISQTAPLPPRADRSARMTHAAAD